MRRATVLVAIVGVLACAAGCAQDEPLQLWLRQSDRAVRHMTLVGHLADGERALPAADEFATFVDGQTYVELTSVASTGQMFYLHLTVPRDLLGDPTFAPGASMALEGQALVAPSFDGSFAAYVSEPELHASIEICDGAYHADYFCCAVVHPASRVDLAFEPCERADRVHVRVHAVIESAADGTPQTVDAAFDLGPE